MKKRFSKIIVCILAATLAALSVCMLAACNGADDEGANSNKPNSKPTDTAQNVKVESINASEYFDRLWTLTSDLGSSAIGENADLALKANMAVELGTKGVTTDIAVQSIELGVEYELVLDRSSKDSAGNYNSRNTALKLKIYSGDIEVCAVYFFIKFPSKIFFDFDGMQVVMSADIAGINDNFGVNIGDFLHEDRDGEGSVNDVLNTFLGVMGPDKNWSLNTPINQLLELAGIPLKSMLVDNENISKFISTMLGIAPEDMFDGDDIDILRILKAETVSSLFTATRTDRSDVKEYVIFMGNSSGGFSGSMNGNFGGNLSGLIGGNVGDDMEGLVDNVMQGMSGIFELVSHANTKIGFLERNDAFDSLYLYTDLKGLNEVLLDVNGLTPVYPYFKCTINDIELGEASDYTLGVNTADYTSEVAFEFKDKFTVGGLGMDRGEAAAADSAASVVEFFAVGTLDLIGEGDENRTRMNAYAAIDGTHVVDVSFNSTTLAIVPNLAFGEGEMKEVVAGIGARIYTMVKTYIFSGNDDELLEQFVNTVFANDEEGNTDFGRLNDSFRGVIITGFDIATTFRNAVKKAIDIINGMKAPDLTPDGVDEKGDGGETAPAPDEDTDGEQQPIPDISQFMPTYDDLVRMLKVAISTVSLKNGNVRFAVDDLIGLMLSVSGEDVTSEQLKAEALELAQEILTENAQTWGGYYGYIVDAVAALRIDGVEPFEAVHTDDEVADVTSAFGYLIDLIVDEPISVTFELRYDSGISVKFALGIAGASATYEMSFNAYAIGSDTFTDLADGHGTQDGYYVLDISVFRNKGGAEQDTNA